MEHLSDKDKYIIEQYQEKERAMVLVYVQWCVNHHVDPVAVYEKAYPDQEKNKVLAEVVEEGLEKEDPSSIDIETLFEVLQLYGNEDLAIAIQKEVEKRTSSPRQGVCRR